ncbi:MAG TPA: hypothetical protein VEA69_16765 [Tepidisphaeraceae bacterium]|nr:hypothetical protein [Tepidisphaeraceae bacterium]
MLSNDPAKMAEEIRRAEDHAAQHHAPIRRMVEQFATKWYREDKGLLEALPTPQNRVFSWVAWMLPQLAFGAPAAVVEANWERAHGPIAQWMEAGGRRWAACYNALADEFSLWVRDALFAYGVLKIGMEEQDGEIRPFLQHVPMDRWGCEAPQIDHVRRSRFQYEKYPVEFEDLAKLRGVDPAAIKEIKDSWEPVENGKGARLKGSETGPRKQFWVYDLWFPDTKEIGTLLCTAKDEPGNVWLRPKRKFWGPKTGPYVVLGFKNVPGDPYPCSDLQPVMHQISAINAHLRAAALEADSFKTGIAVDATMPEAAKGIQEGLPNGVWILPGIATRPNGVQQLSIGGNHPQRLEHIAQMGQGLDRDMAMGDAQLGISNSDTATANDIAAQASNIRIRAMQGIVNAKAADALAGVMWWLFYDPAVEQRISVTATVPDPTGMGAEQQVEQEGFMRGGTDATWYRGEFFPPMVDVAWPEDFTVTVDPESTTHTSNQQRLADALIVGEKVVPTALQMMMQPGVEAEFWTNMVGRAMNRPNLFRSLFSPELVAMAKAGALTPPVTEPAGASPAMGAGVTGFGGVMGRRPEMGGGFGGGGARSGQSTAPGTSARPGQTGSRPAAGQPAGRPVGAGV